MNAELLTAEQYLLNRQFAAYTAALPAFAADSQKVAAPILAHLPLAAVLAQLAQSETDLLTAEKQLLRHYERRIGAPSLAKRFLAVATAEATTVRPGSTYRARFYVVKQLLLPAHGLLMHCNGKPLPVDSNGVGLVRFRATTQPGPAVWTGSVHYKFNGRDTTFQVRVPYRVAWR